MKATYTSREELPLSLNATDVSCALGISRAGAYTLMHRRDFPTLKVNEKRMVVPKDRFLQWVDDNAGAQNPG